MFNLDVLEAPNCNTTVYGKNCINVPTRKIVGFGPSIYNNFSTISN